MYGYSLNQNACAQPPDDSPYTLTWDQVQALPQPVLWIDARSASAYQSGHITGAVLCNENGWEAGLERLFTARPPDATLVAYCDDADCGCFQPAGTSSGSPATIAWSLARNAVLLAACLTCLWLGSQHTFSTTSGRHAADPTE